MRNEPSERRDDEFVEKRKPVLSPTAASTRVIPDADEAA
jgi:hypothetical protein